MTFKEYVLFKNPVGSNMVVKSFVIRLNLDENSNLNGISGLGKRSKTTINKLQVKYKKIKEGIKNESN